jgi:hypothetical protein
VTSSGTFAALAAAALLAGCGGGSRQDASEPSGNFPVQVTAASFPSAQRLSQHSRMLLVVRNTGNKAIPNLAVTVCNVTCATPAAVGQATGAAAFGEDITQSGVADPSRPVWIVDQPPGPCGYSCANGGPGAYVTAYTNTWALGGPLKPGATATFRWGVTAVQPGRHTVAWQVAAGLNGKAKAVLSGGGRPVGTFHVVISSKPAQAYVNDQGQVVTTH